MITLVGSGLPTRPALYACTCPTHSRVGAIYITIIEEAPSYTTRRVQFYCLQAWRRLFSKLKVDTLAIQPEPSYYRCALCLTPSEHMIISTATLNKDITEKLGLIKPTTISIILSLCPRHVAKLINEKALITYLKGDGL
jgi:hypothetical protein